MCATSRETDDVATKQGYEWNLITVQLMLCGEPVFIFTSGSSALRAPTLWFIDLTVATYHIQYTFLSLCHFFSRENGQNTKMLEVSYENGRRRLLGAQSINTERASLIILCLLKGVGVCRPKGYGFGAVLVWNRPLSRIGQLL